jgi:hypothetical protein
MYKLWVRLSDWTGLLRPVPSPPRIWEGVLEVLWDILSVKDGVGLKKNKILLIYPTLTSPKHSLSPPASFLEIPKW